MPTRAEQKAATRERLIDAVGLVIASKGLEGASINDIAGAAGVTSGALYASFSSRAELIEAYVRERNLDLSEIPVEVVARDVGERLEEALEASPLSGRVLVEVLAGGSRDPRLGELMRAAVLANVDALTRRLEEEQVPLRLSPHDTALLLQVLVAGTVVLREVMHEDLPPALLTSAVKELM
jgi:AcrR family transcriptional regulator